MRANYESGARLASAVLRLDLLGASIAAVDSALIEIFGFVRPHGVKF